MKLYHDYKFGIRNWINEILHIDVRNTIYAIFHIDRIEMEDSITISSDADKVINSIPFLTKIRILNKLGIEE
jgi:hypothetical protein